MSEGFETVHTVSDYYYGPRGGIADFGGKPHYYQSNYDDLDGGDEAYLLWPLDDKTFHLAMEDWKIWIRWEAAFFAGETQTIAPRALPEDRARLTDLKQMLEARLTERPVGLGVARAHAEFRPKNLDAAPHWGWPTLEVKWAVIEC